MPGAETVANTTAASSATDFVPPSSRPAIHSFRAADDGLLLSHALLGTFFFLEGAWCFCVLLFPRTKNLKAGPLRTTVLADIVQLVFCVFGILVETVYTIHAAYAYHTVYGGFALAAITQALSDLGIILPEGLDDAAQAGAFSILGLIARAQAYGEVYLTGATRLLTSYAALFNAGVGTLYQLTAFCSRRRCSLLIGQLRAGGIILQGVWFWHVGAVLRSPDRWAEQEHDNIMHLSIAFVWDAFAVALIYSLVTALVGWLSPGQYEESTHTQGTGKLNCLDARKYELLQDSKVQRGIALTQKVAE
ncbi:Transmembrane protein 45B [Sparganum proliferum]